ncbi:hypothetical protein LT493_44290 [Streptomyces tricolor]|nr:hypothetical protein [Streptomyces tricolor]
MPAPAAPAAARPAADPSPATTQQLHWKSCLLGPDDDTTGKELEQAGAQCADVAVPTPDYANEGRALTVAISGSQHRHRPPRGATAPSAAADPAGQTLGDPPWVHRP